MATSLDNVQLVWINKKITKTIEISDFSFFLVSYEVFALEYFFYLLVIFHPVPEPKVGNVLSVNQKKRKHLLSYQKASQA